MKYLNASPALALLSLSGGIAMHHRNANEVDIII